MGLARDRCLETSTTTGTGNFTLAGAVLGYRTISNGIVDLDKSFDYCIEAVDGSGVPSGQWEVGQGHLSSSTTLVRAIPQDSSSGAFTLVNFAAGTKRVFITFSGSELQDKGQNTARHSSYLAKN